MATIVKEVRSDYTPKSLDRLPLEILQRIIATGSCENAIALSQVNKELHAICRNPLIFRHIVEAGNDYPIQYPTDWWSKSPLKSVSEASVAARWALADSKALQLEHNSAGGITLDEKCITWLPHLLAYHHSVFHNAAPSEINAMIDSIVLDTYIAQPISFCSAVRMLQIAANTDVPIMSRSATNLPTSVGMLACVRERLTRVSRSQTNPLGELGQNSRRFAQNLSSITNETEASQIHSIVNFAVGIVGYELRQTLKLNRLQRPDGISTIRNRQPPVPDNIPFASFMTFDPPFSQSADDFRMSHIEKTTSPEFLSDGEWIGYYCYSFQEEPPVFDYMMQDIHFETSSLVTGFVQINASGIDGVGMFQLRGRVSTQTGLITLLKIYDNGPSWSWRAAMTPLGIAGTWGFPGCGGWFWLWKKSWSVESSR